MQSAPTPRDGAQSDADPIQFVIDACPLGWLLVAATGRGVCFVALGDGPAALEAAMRHEFPYAGFRRGGPRGRAAGDALLAYLEGRRTELELPLDVRATRFQCRVWRALQAIPCGETRGYAEVAAAIGRPAAARAVARACATNPVALLIPCHRAVPRAGGTGGYRWGVGRKRALLRREAAAPGTAAVSRMPAASTTSHPKRPSLA